MVSREARSPVHCGCNVESSVGAGIGWSRRGVVGGHMAGAWMLSMSDPWMLLALLNASLLTLVRMSLGLGWAELGRRGRRRAAAAPPRSPHPRSRPNAALLGRPPDGVPVGGEGDAPRRFRWQQGGVPGRRGGIREAVGEAGQTGGVARFGGRRVTASEARSEPRLGIRRAAGAVRVPSSRRSGWPPASTLRGKSR